MDKPNISPKFTIEDIHKIREYNYEATKEMNSEEKSDYYKSKAQSVRKEMELIKKQKQLVTK